MKAFVASIVALVAITAVAAVVFGSLDASSRTEFSSSSTRPPVPQSE